MKRLLLIICGDGTDYFSVPLGCDSVKNVEDAIQKYEQCRLVNYEEAGTGLLALALRIRLSMPKDYRRIINGCKQFEGVCIGGKPMITNRDNCFNVEIDASEIISDDEHDLWKQEPRDVFSIKNKHSYKVVILEDCL